MHVADRAASKRYIPTPVGRFYQGYKFAPAVTVHPHACGEIFKGFDDAAATPGTSPRLWGDFAQLDDYEKSQRYIPTPVGRFPSAMRARHRCSVHPHACGEIRCPTSPYRNKLGTSPRLWGDWRIHMKGSTFLRYIPTPVGRLEHR